jgi:hypothetical protein
MDSLSFTILVIILTGEALYLFKDLAVSWWRNPADALVLFLVVMGFLFSLGPAYYVLLTGHFEVFEFGFPLSAWCFGLTLEVVFCAVLIVMLSLKRRTPLLDSVARTLGRFPRPTHFLVFLALISGFAFMLLWGSWSTGGYEAAGNYIKDSLSTPDVTVAGIQMTIFRSVFFPSVCVLLFYMPRRAVPTWLRPVLWAVFGYAFLRALTSGGRGLVMEVVFAVISCLFAAGKRLKPIAYVVASYLLLTIFTSAIVTFRGNAKSYVGMSLWDKAQIIVQNKQMEAGDSDFQDWAERYLTRLDSIQDGGILAEGAADSHEFASFRPYVGAFLAPLPRYLWKGKPLPLSDNDAVSGLPWYRVMEYRGTPWNNATVSTAGIAYWQFGWLGVIVTAVLGALLMRFLSLLLVRGGAIGLLFFLSFCMMTHFRLPVGLDETILVFTQVLLPLAVACFFYSIPAWVTVREQYRWVASSSPQPDIQVIGH